LNNAPQETSPLAHHLERALDHASVLVSLAQHRLTPEDPLLTLRERQRLQLHDQLHLFSFHARKAIELGGLEEAAKAQPLAGPGDYPPQEVTDLGISSHTTKDLWWVLNRVVHSRTVDFAEWETTESASEWTMDPGQSYWSLSLFRVRSDFDPPDAEHWVEVYHLVRSFLKLLPRFQVRAGSSSASAAV
jgi:hypothetical protein